MVLLAGLAFVLSSSPMLALDPAAANTQYGLRTWTSEDGLPENFVVASAQTPDGYLWFGTEEGLGRFDRVRSLRLDRQTSCSAGIPRRALDCSDESARYKNGADQVLTESAFKGGTIRAMSRVGRQHRRTEQDCIDISG